jgi:hypothetical protein
VAVAAAAAAVVDAAAVAAPATHDMHYLNPIQGGLKSTKNPVVKLKLNLQLEKDGHQMTSTVTSIYKEQSSMGFHERLAYLPCCV